MAARAQAARFPCHQQCKPHRIAAIRLFRQNIPFLISLVHSHPVILSGARPHNRGQPNYACFGRAFNFMPHNSTNPTSAAIGHAFGRETCLSQPMFSNCIVAQSTAEKSRVADAMSEGDLSGKLRPYPRESRMKVFPRKCGTAKLARIVPPEPGFPK